MAFYIDYKKLGAKIKDAREERHLNQKNLARMLGFTNNYLSRVESGTKKISLERVAQISSILSMNLDTLVRGTEVHYVAEGTTTLHHVLGIKKGEEEDKALEILVKRGKGDKRL